MKISRLAVFLMLLLFSGTGAAGFCKWEDENGVTYYAENCPENVDATEIETQASPSQEQVYEATRKSEELLENRGVRKEEFEAQKAEQKSKAARSQNYADDREKDGWSELLLPEWVDCAPLLASKSIQELEALCEQEKEKRIKPEREAEIKACKERKENDPDWCERYWATYGDGRRQGLYMRPQKYSWLPECVEARKCREEAEN